ncbi:cytochrome C assembly family protein [Bacillus alkalicellulosilyticus]|uniref:cytochrome C assembly family protein n=1 Tax=Alkalihalobacterium alkalicellulosilyticum TaxID=1912214 RepID=UPI000996269E|nr:cytochrome c biogenesis protein [Bacillus alkalicellulosilyticus]
MFNVIYLITIILYCLSVLGYFIDFIQNNRKANRIAFWLLSIVWVLQTTIFLLRMAELNRLPILTQFEGLFFYAWVVVTISLFINWYFRVDFLVFIANVFGFVMMAISLFVPTGDVSQQLSQLLISELLVIHVVLILLSYAAFNLAFAISLMYVMQHQMLKRKIWGKRLLRFGNLSKLDKLAFIMTMFAFPTFLLGIILGFVWSSIELGELPFTDAKVISSLVVLGVYAVYLYQRVVKLVRGYTMALLNIAAFLLLLINYFMLSRFSEFHLWY